MGLHQRELPSADHAARSLVERTVDGYEVGALQQLVERDLDRPALLDGVGIEIRIARNHLHGEEAAAEFGHAAADIAEADDADGPALHIIAHEGRAVAHG